MNRKIGLKFQVNLDHKGQRIDLVISKAFIEFSRNHLQRLIKDGAVKVNGKEVKPRHILQGDELIEIFAEEPPQIKDEPQQIDLDIVHEDQDILVINKNSGLVVHPGAGNKSGTLVNGLINFDPNLSYLPRAGIVHRLDKDTSGLMVVSRNEKSYLNLVNQLKERTVKRVYKAIVVGEPSLSGIIDKPIGRHPKVRTKQAVVKSGKQAITQFKTIDNFKGYSLVEASLETGRTHQIRVHLSYLGFPIIGDSIYGGRRKYAKGTSQEIRNIIDGISRQALHASILSFNHPLTEKNLSFKSKLPEDMYHLLATLKKNDA